jgi:hypothetical protein
LKIIFGGIQSTGCFGQVEKPMVFRRSYVYFLAEGDTKVRNGTELCPVLRKLRRIRY